MRSNVAHSAEAAFWEWFLQNDEAIWNFESAREVVFADLLKELHGVHPDLTFEIGPEQNGVREFVVSAGGLKSAFPAVERLVAEAPPLGRWKLIKFRPRRSEIGTIEIGDIIIDPKAVMFTIEPDGTKFGITLFLGKLHDFDKDIHTQIGFLVLDETLGEYDVETQVGYIAILPEEASNGLPKRPLRHLAAAFDRLKATRGL